VLDIAIDPTNTGLVYLAANFPYMRSSDDEPWQLIEGLLSLSPSGVQTIEANNAGVVFAGGQFTNGKIFLSTDQGATWQQELLFVSAGVLNISMDPSNQDIMYVVTTSNFSGSQNKVIIKSIDGGSSWTPLDMTSILPIGYNCNDLAVDPDDSETLVALGDGGFSFPAKAILSLDGGESWQDITSGLPSGKPFNEVTFRDGAIYISGGQLFGGNIMGIYKSGNLGSSWQDVSIGFPVKVVNDILIDPFDANLMYAATEGDGIYYSVDGGVTWNYETGGAGDNGSARKILFNPDDATELYAGFLSLGVCISEDSGNFWTSSVAGIASLKLNDIEIDLNAPEIILASFEAENSGGCYLFDPLQGGWGLVTSLPATRFSSVSIGIDGRMYAWSNGPTTVAAEGVYRSGDGGQTWENMGPDIGPVFETQIFSMVLSESNPDLIFIGGNNFGANGWASMIYRSTDAGENWDNVFMGPDNDGFKYLYIDPVSNDQTVYAAYKTESSGGGFIKSIDGGDNWLPINTGIPSATKWGGAIICDPDNADILYGGAGGYGGTAGMVYRSENGGSSWTAMNMSLSNFSKVTDLLLSPLNPGVIYASTTLNGVFMTEDGENWSAANEGLAATNITGFSRLFEDEEEKPGFYASSFTNSAFYTELYEPGAIGVNKPALEEEYIRLWPNPAQGSFNLHANSSKINTTGIRIYSSEGNLITSMIHEFGNTGTVNIALHDLPGGIYYVVIDSETGPVTKKLVVLK